MKNTFGNSLSVTLFGESHGECVGCVLDGLCPGIDIDESYINKRLSLRKPYGSLTTERKEKDEFKIVSGAFKGKTTGTPLTIIIPNTDCKSEDYESDNLIFRPSHADYTGFVKYNGFNDKNGGGHFSGRLTSPLVAASGIILPALKNKGIDICSHIEKIGKISDRRFEDYENDIKLIKDKKFPVFSETVKENMEKEILNAKENGDSSGGIIETVITGVPAGLGEPWFDTVEGMLSHIMFSIPAIKGIEFGDGFDLTKKHGSEANDKLTVKNGKISYISNNMGGIDGGITNGSAIVFRCAVKPTPTISKEQQTVNLTSMENTVLKSTGRHDSCIALRMPSITESAAALCIYDLLATHYGTNTVAE